MLLESSIPRVLWIKFYFREGWGNFSTFDKYVEDLNLRKQINLLKLSYFPLRTEGDGIK